MNLFKRTDFLVWTVTQSNLWNCCMLFITSYLCTLTQYWYPVYIAKLSWLIVYLFLCCFFSLRCRKGPVSKHFTVVYTCCIQSIWQIHLIGRESMWYVIVIQLWYVVVSPGYIEMNALAVGPSGWECLLHCNVVLYVLFFFCFASFLDPK
jgi:hypothetical protein